jgi:hypothetical protein
VPAVILAGLPVVLVWGKRRFLGSHAEHGGASEALVGYSVVMARADGAAARTPAGMAVGLALSFVDA